MEKTLGQIAWEAESVELGDGGWEYTTVNDQRKAQAVADAVIQAYEARRWKPMESASRKPDEKDLILAYNKSSKRCHVVWPTYEGWTDGEIDEDGCYCCWSFESGHLTHWTPIPAPPKEASDAE